MIRYTRQAWVAASLLLMPAMAFSTRAQPTSDRDGDGALPGPSRSPVYVVELLEPDREPDTDAGPEAEPIELRLSTTVDGVGPEQVSPNSTPAKDPFDFTFKIYSENDGALHDPFDGFDRHYTNGLALVFEDQPAWADDALGWMPFAGAFSDRHGKPKSGVGYVLGHKIFTPADLYATAPIPNDQPYAGYAYAGVFLQREGRYRGRDDAGVLDHFELNIGVVGKETLAGPMQTWVHERLGGIEPQGWGNQLDSEVTGQFYYRRKWRYDMEPIESAWLGTLDWQVIPQAGVALGTVYRYIDLGVTARIGYHLNDDFGPGRINDPQSTTGDPTHRDGWSGYVFGRIGGQVVEHNLFLDGSNYSNPSQSVDRAPLVGEVQAGIAFGYQPAPNHRFDMSWGLTFHSETFDSPLNGGVDSYGTLVLSWFLSF